MLSPAERQALIDKTDPLTPEERALLRADVRAHRKSARSLRFSARRYRAKAFLEDCRASWLEFRVGLLDLFAGG